eukprot:scaffold328_cov130-Cylindrotheca_fusiformis.AAC.8
MFVGDNSRKEKEVSKEPQGDDDNDKEKNDEEASQALHVTISEEYSDMDNEDTVLKKQQAKSWNLSFAYVVDEYQSSDSSRSSAEDDSQHWQEGQPAVPYTETRIVPERKDVGGERKDENVQPSLDRYASLATTTPPPPELARRNNYRDTAPGAIPIRGEISRQASDATIQIGDTADKDPSDIMEAVQVDESREQGVPELQNEVVLSAIPMSEDNLSPTDDKDSDGGGEATRIPSSISDDAISSIPTAAPTASLNTLIDLLRDSVEDVTPWDNRTTPQYKALFWLANEDEWTPANIDNGVLRIPIQIIVERYALVVLCMALSGVVWIQEAGILNATAASCNWSVESEYDFHRTTGVKCNGQFVSGVSLCMSIMFSRTPTSVSLEAVGQIPTEVGLLSSLEYFFLDWNDLYGTIPSELFRLPKLETLSFENNELSGTIPSEVGLAESLQTLNLGHNEITGTLDNAINPSLTSLSLAYNRLDGKIPRDFGTMTMMEHLDLSDNNLSGPVPSNLADMQDLKTLILHFNTHLTGAIPTTFSSLNLSELHLEVRIVEELSPKHNAHVV